MNKVISRIKQIMKSLPRRGVEVISCRPVLKHSIIFVVHKLGLYSTVRALHVKLYADKTSSTVTGGSQTVIANLYPRACEIFSDRKVAMTREHGKHEIILDLNGLLQDTSTAIRVAFENLLLQENVHVWQATGPVMSGLPDNGFRRIHKFFWEASL